MLKFIDVGEKKMRCSVTEWVKEDALKWFVLVERMHEDQLVTKIRRD